MKEIDTESTVIWPSWCYSDNIATDVLKQPSSTTTDGFIDIKTENSIVNIKTEIAAKKEKPKANSISPSNIHTINSDRSSQDYILEKSKETYQNGYNNVTHKSPSPILETTTTTANVPTIGVKRNNKNTNKTFRQSKSTAKSNNSNNNYLQRDYLRSPKSKAPSQEAADLTTIPNSFTDVVAAAEKMISERSLLLNRFNSLGSSKKLSNSSSVNTSTSIIAGDIGTTAAGTPTHSPHPGAAAAAFLYLEKLKNDKLASSHLTAAQLDSLKETIMESASIGNNNINNNPNNNNNSNNNNNNNNNNSILSNNNNLLISHVQSNTSTASGGGGVSGSSSSGGGGGGGSCANSNITGNQHNQQHLQQQQNQQNHCNNTRNNNNNNNNNSNNSSSSSNCGIKRERLSPGGTNGELQSKLARSRCTTPSSYRGTTSPQLALHNSSPDTLMPMHNLSTNLINNLQQAASSTGRQLQANANLSSTSGPTMPTDFSTRNYSDIMRSLAAKYNNSLSNDNSVSRRNIFFENSASGSSTSSNTSSNNKLSNPILKTNSNNAALSSSLMIKDLSATTALAPPSTPSTNPTLPPPPTQAALPPPALSPNFALNAAATIKSQNAQNQIAAAAVEAGVSPLMTSFLCSLPFVQGVFPPLIDMSSTQALLTLARASKEAEIQSVLRTARNPKRPNSSASTSPRPNLNVALQQAAQFISPTLLYAAQMQQTQQQQQQQQEQELQQQQQQQQQQSLTRPTSRQSSPRDTNVVATSSNDHTASSGITAPLDLSSQQPAAKRFKAESTSRRVSSTSLSASPSPSPALSERSTNNENSRDIKSAEATIVTSTKTNAANTNLRQCQAQSEEVNSWTVDEVCSFVGGIDICAEYVQHFRDQCIDGSGLPLLTEDHLVNSLGMKLGPALKLRSMLAKKLGGPCPCVACVAQTQQMLALQAATAAVASSSTITTNTVTPTKSHSNKIIVKASTEATTITTTTTETTTTASTGTEAEVTAASALAGVEDNFAREAGLLQQQLLQHTTSNVTAAVTVGCSNKKNDEEIQKQQDETTCMDNKNQNQLTMNVAIATPATAPCNNINNNDSNKSSNGCGSIGNISNSSNVTLNIGNNSIGLGNSNDNSDGLAFIGHGRRGRSSSNSSHSHSSHSDAKRPASADFLGDGS